MFTYVGFHLKSGFKKLLCSQMLVFTLILVSRKYCVHQFFLYTVSVNDWTCGCVIPRWLSLIHVWIHQQQEEDQDCRTQYHPLVMTPPWTCHGGHMYGWTSSRGQALDHDSAGCGQDQTPGLAYQKKYLTYGEVGLPIHYFTTNLMFQQTAIITK